MKEYMLFDPVIPFLRNYPTGKCGNEFPIRFFIVTMFIIVQRLGINLNIICERLIKDSLVCSHNGKLQSYKKIIWEHFLFCYGMIAKIS